MQVNQTAPNSLLFGPIKADVGTSSTTGSTSSSGLPTQTLSQSDFLNLLVTQMQQQDPMNPMSDTDLAAQMAQFTALSQAQQTTTEITQLATQQQLQQATNLIGSTVTLAGANGSTVTGTVTCVTVNSGTPSLIVNGLPYDMSTLLSVAPAAGNTQTSSSTPTTSSTQAQ